MSQGKLPENVMAQVKIILGKWERSEIYHSILSKYFKIINDATKSIGHVRKYINK
jgi:hypothetical protein